MNQIKIDKVGQILSGDDSGYFVKILDDSENTGGYLVLVSESKLFDTGHDDWVQDIKSLRGYFDESSWTIDWLE